MNILDKYPVFENNQVLTSDQLNNLAEYLDQQNRLTRARLIGIGTVCGFNLSYSDNTLLISKGIGITSNGFLITQGDCYTTKYRKYQLPATVRYAPFEDIITKIKNFDLYELLTTDADPGSSSTTNLTSDFLSDKAVLLFLEIFDQDLKTCLAKSCDEIGQTRLFTLRKLLIKISDLDLIIQNLNFGRHDPTFPVKFELPVISIPRITIKPDDPAVSSKAALLKKYRDALFPEGENEDSVLDELITAINKINILYSPVLKDLYKDNFVDEIIQEFSTKMDSYLANYHGKIFHGSQYFYDFIKDLILAYDEFKNTAFELCSECITDIERFPQHLMLGPAIPPEKYNIDSTPYRSRYIQSPAYSQQKNLADKTRSLHQRLVSMIISFNLDSISKPDKFLAGTYIIPSHEKLTRLSRRSIPFYYDPDNAELPLINSWNFDIEKRKLSENILTCHHQPDSNDPVKDPLKYNLDKYSFLRIEGVLGKEAGALQDDLNTKKIDFNLPLNIITLITNSSSDTLKLNPELWNDLNVAYIESLNQFKCVLQNLYGDVKNLKSHNLKLDYVEIDPDKIKALIDDILSVLPENIDKFLFPEFFNKYCNLIELIHLYRLALLYSQGKLINVLINVTPSEELQNSLKVIEESLWFIQRLIISCIYRDFYLLYYRLIGRKRHLVKNHPSILSNFLKRHPGIEHAGGVNKGGTFILVREDNTPEPDLNGKNKIFADFSLPYVCSCDCFELPTLEQELENVRLPDLALPDSGICIMDKSIDISVLQNDFIAGAGRFTITTDSQYAVYDPGKNLIVYNRTNYTGIDSFNYTINRNIIDGLINSALVQVLTRQEYTPHIKASNDQQIVRQHDVLEFDLLENDIYYNSTTLTLPERSMLGGQIIKIPYPPLPLPRPRKGLIRFIPAGAGKDSFTYLLKDDEREENSEAVVSIFVTKFDLTVNDIVFLVTISGENYIPIILQQGWSIASIISQLPPVMGMLSVDPLNSAIVFKPGTGYAGNTTLSFSYVLINEKGEPVTGVVHLINYLQQNEDYKDYFDNIMAGTIMAFAWEADPKWLVRNGWLVCDGSMFETLTYKRLFDRIGTLYGTGNGRATFNVPDLRDQFVRGWNNDSRNPRKVGSLQQDQLQGHTHSESGKGHTHDDGLEGHFHDCHSLEITSLEIKNGSLGSMFIQKGKVIPTETSKQHVGLNMTRVSVGNPENSNPYGTVRYGAETRPQNMAVIYCIKY